MRIVKRLYIAIRESISLGRAVKPRAAKWEIVKRNHLINEPICQWCGNAFNLIVHHIYPVHLFPELELDKNNLITLCRNKNCECHLRHGHNGDWRKYNALIREACENKKGLYIFRENK